MKALQLMYSVKAKRVYYLYLSEEIPEYGSQRSSHKYTGDRKKEELGGSRLPTYVSDPNEVHGDGHSRHFRRRKEAFGRLRIHGPQDQDGEQEKTYLPCPLF